MHKSWVLKNSYSVFLSNLTPFYLLSSLSPSLLFSYRVSQSRLVWNSLHLKLKTTLFQLAQYLECRCESPHLTSGFFYLSLWTKNNIDTLVITNMKCFINPIAILSLILYNVNIICWTMQHHALLWTLPWPFKMVCNCNPRTWEVPATNK